jgi:hypothetical protein
MRSAGSQEPISPYNKAASSRVTSGANPVPMTMPAAVTRGGAPQDETEDVSYLCAKRKANPISAVRCATACAMTRRSRSPSAAAQALRRCAKQSMIQYPCRARPEIMRQTARQEVYDECRTRAEM